ncbi:hypothetical protein M405DRAFT_830482 [Rhizopogon salebrosus TDB-379]|nr:hypothetical protein M405DRAFT_830482 [Rhizopogon salebrosus TDB-379]
MWAQHVSASESLTCEAAARYDMDEAPVVDVPGSETRDSALEERMTTVEIRFWTHGVPYDGFSFEYGFSSQPPYWARAKARAGCGCDVLPSSSSDWVETSRRVHIWLKYGCRPFD